MVDYTDCSVILTGEEAFSPEQTFSCGQCFRFEPTENGSWKGIAFERSLEVSLLNNGVLLNCSPWEYDHIWKHYFGFNQDLTKLSSYLKEDDFLLKAYDFGKGIRLLSQDPFETMISFILSQCNNIPRIKGIIEKMCKFYGRKIAEGEYAFPKAETLADLKEDDLAPLRAGYRAKYIVNASKCVAAGEIDLKNLKNYPTDEARRILMGISGIGRKVADCILLFGLSKMDAFPTDVWIKKVMKQIWPNGLDTSQYGEYAGLIQQYIYYYAREHAELFR